MTVGKKIGNLGIIMVSTWLASVSAAPPAAGSAQEHPAEPAREGVIKVQGAANPGDADARHCLQHTDNLQVIRCAEPFRRPLAANSSRQG